jgi:microcompartment protein CcmL/EutN
MKSFPALATVEYDRVSVGMHATDALLKKSPISLVRCGTISRGRYLAVFGGSTASVDEALQEALYWSKDHTIDHAFLPDISLALHDGILEQRRLTHTGALLVLETETVSAAVIAAERALKCAPVELAEIRLGDPQLNARGLVLIQGELYDVEAARDTALQALDARETPGYHRLLTAPHETMIEQVAASTEFNRATNSALEGEC